MSHTNPLVGAVLCIMRIIGEGFHALFGMPAEVNCIKCCQALINLDSRIYLVCFTRAMRSFWKDPALYSLILEAGIKRVVIGMRDILKR